MKLKSYGGEPTRAQKNLEGLRGLIGALVVVAIVVGAFLFANWVGNKQEENKVAEEQCVQIIPDSVFTTGDPILDQRILYAITQDKSKNHEDSGELVKHLWDKGDFNFESEGSKELWNEANKKVTKLKSIEKPALSITQEGVIIPYNEPDELKNVEWTEVSVAAPSAKKSESLMVSSYGEEEKTPVAPTVLLNISGSSVVPSPTLGKAADHQAVETKEVCE